MTPVQPIPPPRVIVTGRQRPIQIGLMVASVCLGLANAFGFGPSPSIDGIGLPLYAIIWGGLLAASGALGLFALRLELPGALIYERIAVVGISTCFATWAIALGFGLGPRSLSTFFLVAGLAAGCIVRAVLISRDLRTLLKASARE